MKEIELPSTGHSPDAWNRLTKAKSRKFDLGFPCERQEPLPKLPLIVRVKGSRKLELKSLDLNHRDVGVTQLRS